MGPQGPVAAAMVPPPHHLCLGCRRRVGALVAAKPMATRGPAVVSARGQRVPAACWRWHVRPIAGVSRYAARDLRAPGPILVLLVVTLVGLAGEPIKAAPVGEVRGPWSCWPGSAVKRTAAADLGRLRCLRGRQRPATEPLVSGLAAGRATPVPVAAGAGRWEFTGGADARTSVVQRRSRWRSLAPAPGRAVVRFVLLSAATSGQVGCPTGGAGGTLAVPRRLGKLDAYGGGGALERRLGGSWQRPRSPRRQEANRYHPRSEDETGPGALEPLGQPTAGGGGWRGGDGCSGVIGEPAQAVSEHGHERGPGLGRWAAGEGTDLLHQRGELLVVSQFLIVELSEEVHHLG